MKIRIPKWWFILTGIFLALLINSQVSDAQLRDFRVAEGMSVEGYSNIQNLKESFGKGLAFGLEALMYYFSGTLMMVGIPTLVGILVYAALKKLYTSIGLVIGFIALLVAQITLEALI